MKPTMQKSVVIAIETATFPHRVSQADALAFALRSVPDGDRARVRRLYERSEIETRHLAVPDMLDCKGQGAGVIAAPVERRLDVARDVAAPVAVDVTQRALASARVAPSDVGELVVVTSTALNAPGVDVALIRQLGLRSNITRVNVNYMGCAAGLSGLRIASDYVVAAGTSNPQVTALVVCVETSSLHMRHREGAGQQLTHSLFADGASCAVVGTAERYRASRIGAFAIGAFESLLLTGCEDGIRLRIDGDAIDCMLSRSLPSAVREGLARWLGNLLEKSGIAKHDLRFWAIHPGGRRIIDGAECGLGIGAELTTESRETLRKHGNVLSCGAYFVLHEMLQRGVTADGDKGVAVSFAPGVSIEGVLLERLPEGVATRKTLRVRREGKVVLPLWAQPSLPTRLRELDPRPDDVSVVTFPKSGTTWLLQILHLLRREGRQGEVTLDRCVGWFERDPVETLAALPAPRLFKTHLPMNVLPLGGKVVYVARNPKDVAVSYYHHARAKLDFGFDGSWEDFLELFLRGEVEGGDWCEHVRDGIAASWSQPERVLFIWYEELRRSPLRTIARVAGFLGAAASPRLLRDVARLSTLQRMKQDPRVNVRWSAERPGAMPHLRRGSVGEWDELFTYDQERRLEQTWRGAAEAAGIVVPLTPAEARQLTSQAVNGKREVRALLPTLRSSSGRWLPQCRRPMATG